MHFRLGAAAGDQLALRGLRPLPGRDDG
jgi:hypothetical protein